MGILGVEELAPGVVAFTSPIVNAYGLEGPDGPVLVDGGLGCTAVKLAEVFEARFGGPAKAILLTHGHPDHAGGARVLAKKWDVKVYVHPMERPYLVGRSRYPSPDVTLGGPVALVARFFQTPMTNLTSLIENLPEGGEVPFLPDWKWIATPGHSPGHVSFWNQENGVLLCGDSMATADYESWPGFIESLVTRKPKLSIAGGAFVCDWEQEIESVHKSDELKPRVIGPGHGPVMRAEGTAMAMEEFSEQAHAPEVGRYVGQPAEADETGLKNAPPPAKDDLPKKVLLASGVAVVSAGIIAASVLRSKRKD